MGGFIKTRRRQAVAGPLTQPPLLLASPAPLERREPKVVLDPKLNEVVAKLPITSDVTVCRVLELYLE